MLQRDRQIPVLVWIGDPDQAKLDLLRLSVGRNDHAADAEDTTEFRTVGLKQN